MLSNMNISRVNKFIEQTNNKATDIEQKRNQNEYLTVLFSSLFCYAQSIRFAKYWSKLRLMLPKKGMAIKIVAFVLKMRN